jgi:membrane protease YdiL (CAAX protease family)
MENQSEELIPGKTERQNLLLSVLKKHVDLVRRHFVLAAVLVILFGFILYRFYHTHELTHGIGYLAAMWVCMFITDLWMMIFPSSAQDEPQVKQPRQEGWIFLLFAALGSLGLMYRFVFFKDWGSLPGWQRLPILPFFLFMTPIALALYLLLKRYRLKDLALKFDKNILLALPVIAVTGLTAWTVAPGNILFNRMIQEEGILQTLFLGFITAALSEEFFRYIGQTRLGRLFNNAGWGWFITALIWALMHAPRIYSENNRDIIIALTGCLIIAPIGLMWSYMILRTKSIMPSILVHGSNLWGLQNGGM